MRGQIRGRQSVTVTIPPNSPPSHFPQPQSQGSPPPQSAFRGRLGSIRHPLPSLELPLGHCDAMARASDTAPSLLLQPPSHAARQAHALGLRRARGSRQPRGLRGVSDRASFPGGIYFEPGFIYCVAFCVMRSHISNAPESFLQLNEKAVQP